ncbi:conserved hypothetical phage tail region protein [Aequorivita sublithincola DSM 14238]|uniref:Conserved hypothetical phage tail region protein n=1 Tax=Aequorivita sublithincola (strain DSM 14238 / LMG 21431 / ACAM 643 / 9-3) TaxID=746697 RepID=I3YW27_AEQSU|nr:phage tail protein [Aequorivita sublithincola]AFL81195.1 conserved hypothetical phage tail region protein [Aequorivita sublithincola DSM 14238]
MSDESAQDNPWLLPKFYFAVSLGSQNNIVSFKEVLGLDIKAQIIEYRHGDSPIFSTVKMPGITKFGSIIMKKGIFVNGTNFWEWYDAIKMNTVKRETVIIYLLDENGKPTMIWTLNNAWPTKITVVNMEADANEIAVETLELSHEGLTIQNS